MDKRLDLLNFDREELSQELERTLDFRPFRARQLVQWIYKRRVRDFSLMTDIAQQARQALEERYYISRPKLSKVEQSMDGTRKYLFELSDGSEIESVLIKQPKRYTLCVSSQVGCAIGCTFCRTGLMGLKRHLETAEIVGQVLAVQDDLEELNKERSEEEQIPNFYNIVFMGMGEPFHNLKNVTRAVVILNDNLGLDFSGRKITVSTSGLIPAIQAFGESEARANLAISLNATTNEVRDKIIPINRKWPLEELLKTLRAYPLQGKKRITIEYVMLQGVNDTDADLQRLPKLLHGIPSKINLIPYNDNAGLGFKPSSRNNVMRWQRALLDRGMSSSIRWSKGPDINAACGQLATESSKKKKKATTKDTKGSTKVTKEPSISLIR